MMLTAPTLVFPHRHPPAPTHACSVQGLKMVKLVNLSTRKFVNVEKHGKKGQRNETSVEGYEKQSPAGRTKPLGAKLKCLAP